MAPGEACRNTAAADPQGRYFVIGKEIGKLNCSVWRRMRLLETGQCIVLIWYWFTFFRDARPLTSAPPRQADQRQVTMGVDDLITGENKSVG